MFSNRGRGSRRCGTRWCPPRRDVIRSLRSLLCRPSRRRHFRHGRSPGFPRRWVVLFQNLFSIRDKGRQRCASRWCRPIGDDIRFRRRLVWRRRGRSPGFPRRWVVLFQNLFSIRDRGSVENLPECIFLTNQNAASKQSKVVSVTKYHTTRPPGVGPWPAFIPKPLVKLTYKVIGL